MTRWSLEAIPKRNEKAVWREAEDELFICTPDGETLVSVSHVGADIWRSCDGKKTLGEIVGLLLAHYDVAQTTLEADLEEYLENLASHNLLSVVDS